MNKNLFFTASILLLGLIFFPGCQKSTKDEPVITSENQLESRSHHGGTKKGCRLISGTSEYGYETYQYNRKGLLDEWFISFYEGFFKQEYDWKGRLVKSRLFSGNEVVNTIKFYYRDNKVVKETWFVGETDEKADEIVYHYNWKGQIAKSESIIQDYAVVFEYNREGNFLKGLFSLAGKPYL